MNEQTVRAQAEAFGQALVDGDIDRAIGHFSQELRRNTGEVIALLPLPVSDVAVESVAHSGSGENVVPGGPAVEPQRHPGFECVADGKLMLAHVATSSRTLRSAACAWLSVAPTVPGWMSSTSAILV